MSSLYEKYGNSRLDCDNIGRISPDEIADALLCVCNAVEEGTLIQAAPENIEIKEDGMVSVTSDGNLNLYYAAPEVVLGKTDGDKDAGWFTLGLIAYFIVNGRSYYEDYNLNVVELQERMDSGTSLIHLQDIDENAEDVPNLLKMAMRKFTSWKPEVRSAGVPILLKAIQQYPSTAAIRYICSGQVVYAENRLINPPFVSITSGTDMVSGNGTAYRVDGNYKISFRPGVHSYSIRVIADNTSRYERYLCIKDISQQKKVKIMKLEADTLTRKIAVEHKSGKTYYFYVLTGDSVLKRTIGEEYKGYVTIPADVNDGNSLLQVTYEPLKGFGIALYNREGTTQISDNMIWFDL